MIAPVGIENHMTLLNARGSAPLFKVCEEKPKSVTISKKGIHIMKKNRTLALLLMLSMLFPSCANEQTADRPPIPGESDTVSEDQSEDQPIAETQIET